MNRTFEPGYLLMGTLAGTLAILMMSWLKCCHGDMNCDM